MPPIKRSNLARRTRHAIICQNFRDNQTQEERAAEKECRRAHIAQVRAAQSPPQIQQNVRRTPVINVSLNRAAFEYDSSGIAATLLEGGRTAHSALKLPMNLLTVDNPTCTMTKNSATAKLMRECKIIIWDECTMSHKRALEAVDRTMKDLRGDSRQFGGAMILLSGDFRQTLPVIPKATAADELNA